MKTTQMRAIILIGTVAMGLASGLRAQAGIVSAGGRAARELAEELAEQAGKKAGRGFVETASVELGRIAGTCGDESFDVIRKHGIAAYRVFQKAGDDAGPYLTRAIRVHGDAALRVGQTAAGRTILREGSDAAIRAVARHGDAAIPLIRQYGDDAAEAFGNLSGLNGRRLIQAGEERLWTKEQLQALLEPIRMRGDRAMDFIWKNRRVLAGGVLLAAFVANPDPYLNGARKLVADPIARIASGALGRIVDAIHWNLWFGAAALLLGLRVLMGRRLLPAKAGKEKGR